MVVQNVTNTTAGQYTCIATNDVGTSQVNIFLEVTYGMGLFKKLISQY